ncbi:MAG: hypothetical protein ACR2KK_12455 [Acidimicrobiales bacterium]
MALVAAVVDSTVRYAWQRWRTFVPLSAFHDGPADDYELAMLTEGRDLVVLVALSNLDSVGALELARRESRFRRPGAKVEPDSSIVASVGWLQPPAHPVEAAVFRAVFAGNESKRTIADHSAVGAALGDLCQRMVATGLLDPRPPPELAERQWFRGFHPRSLLGNELVRRLRKNHPVESMGTLVALFGEKMLAKVAADLAPARAPTRRPLSWETIALSALSALGDFGGDGMSGGGEVDTGGTW